MMTFIAFVFLNLTSRISIKSIWKEPPHAPLFLFGHTCNFLRFDGLLISHTRATLWPFMNRNARTQAAPEKTRQVDIWTDQHGRLLGRQEAKTLESKRATSAMKLTRKRMDAKGELEAAWWGACWCRTSHRTTTGTTLAHCWKMHGRKLTGRHSARHLCSSGLSSLSAVRSFAGTYTKAIFPQIVSAKYF